MQKGRERSRSLLWDDLRPSLLPSQVCEGMPLWEILPVTVILCLLQTMCHSHMHAYTGPPHPHTPKCVHAKTCQCLSQPRSQTWTPLSPVLVQADCTGQGSKNACVQPDVYTPTIPKKKIMFLCDLRSPHCEELSFIPAYTLFSQSKGSLHYTTGIEFPSWGICSPPKPSQRLGGGVRSTLL